MRDPLLIDLVALLAPIAGDSPVGPNLNSSPLFDNINDLRTTDDPGGVVDESIGKLREGQARVADWPKVIALCTKTLATKSKNLSLVAYLAEGLAREHGLQGVHDGILLLTGATERYWPKIYPQIVENGSVANSAGRSGKVNLDQESTGTIPRATLRGRNHPTVCPLVLAVFAQLPGSGRNNGRARPLRGPCHNLALGPAFRAHSKSTASPRTPASQSVLARG